MATKRWLGRATAIAHVRGYTFGGTWEADDVITCTIGNKAFNTTSGSTTITTIVDTLVTAWNALDGTVYPEFAELTASRSGNDFRLTADTAGVPFTVTLSTTEAGGGAADLQTIDGATSSTGVQVTANSGPADWSVAANWSTNSVPVNSDDVVIENNAQDILYGLAQSAVTLTSLSVRSTYTGRIGLPQDNGTYDEYRAQFLAISATTVTIGEATGTGGQSSPRIKLDTGSNATAITVYTTGIGTDVSGLEAFLWKGAHASNILEVYGGQVGVAVLAGEVATLSTLKVGGQGQVRCSSGVTLTTVDQSDGNLVTNTGCTTATITGGTLTLVSGNITTLNVNGGVCRYLGSGTITTVNVRTDGTLDLTRDLTSRTFTNTNLYENCTYIDTYKTVTWTNAAVINAPLAKMRIDLGVTFSLQRS